MADRPQRDQQVSFTSETGENVTTRPVTRQDAELLANHARNHGGTDVRIQDARS